MGDLIYFYIYLYIHKLYILNIFSNMFKAFYLHSFNYWCVPLYSFFYDLLRLWPVYVFRGKPSLLFYMHGNLLFIRICFSGLIRCYCGMSNGPWLADCISELDLLQCGYHAAILVVMMGDVFVSCYLVLMKSRPRM